MDVMRSGFVTVSDLGVNTHHHPADFSAAMEAVRRVPRRDWRYRFEHLASASISPGRPARITTEPAQIQRFADVLTRYHDAALASIWPSIVAETQLSTDVASRRLANGGIKALFESLHPSVTWSDPVLSVQLESEHTCPPSCPHRQAIPHLQNHHGLEFHLEGRGLYLVPSVFAERVFLGVQEHPDEAPFVIIYPVETNHVKLFASRGTGGGSLPALLGSTRAALLSALWGSSRTTSQLAKIVAVSPPTASEHATVLRAAGLIESHRDGNRMHHQLTALGATLLTAAG